MNMNVNISLIIFVGAVLYMSEKKVDRKLLMALAAGGGLLFLMSRNQDTFDEKVCGSDGGADFFNYCPTERPDYCGSGSGDGCSDLTDVSLTYLWWLLAGALFGCFFCVSYAYDEVGFAILFFIVGFICFVVLAAQMVDAGIKIYNYKPVPTITYDNIIKTTVTGTSGSPPSVPSTLTIKSKKPNISPSSTDLKGWTWSVKKPGLPNGLKLAKTTGVISGTIPNKAASEKYTITATPPKKDNKDKSITGVLHITVEKKKDN